MQSMQKLSGWCRSKATWRNQCLPFPIHLFYFVLILVVANKITFGTISSSMTLSTTFSASWLIFLLVLSLVQSSQPCFFFFIDKSLRCQLLKKALLGRLYASLILSLSTFYFLAARNRPAEGFISVAHFQAWYQVLEVSLQMV